MGLARSLITILSATALGVFVPAAAVAQAQPNSAQSDEAYGPQKLVDKAASVVAEMDGDPDVRPLVQRAVGLYIIPEFGRAGLIFGGKGGAGVVVVRKPRGGWTSPAFFVTSGLTVGLQIGAAGGSIVYLLMDRKAVDAFRTTNKFALTADAGLSVVTYSKGADVSSLKGDAILWTNISGAFAGATVGATDVHVDEKRTRQFYGYPIGVNALLAGRATAPGARALTRVLPP